MELTDILSDKPIERTAPVEKTEAAPVENTEVVDAPEKPEVERVTSRRAKHREKELAAQGRDPYSGQFVKKEEPGAETKKEEPKAEPAKPEVKAEPAKQPAEELTAKERAAFAKAADETRKRQDLERQIAELRAGKPPAEPEKPKPFWDNPEEALQRHKDEVRQTAMNERLRTAEMIARSRYPDFEEKLQVFGELVQQTPGLAQQWLNSNDPGDFVYKLGKAHLELRQAGGLEELRKKIETDTAARVRAEVEAEHKAKQDALDKERKALVPSLSDVRGGGSRPAPVVFQGPTPLDTILGKS